VTKDNRCSGRMYPLGQSQVDEGGKEQSIKQKMKGHTATGKPPRSKMSSFCIPYSTEKGVGAQESFFWGLGDHRIQAKEPPLHQRGGEGNSP